MRIYIFLESREKLLNIYIHTYDLKLTRNTLLNALSKVVAKSTSEFKF